MKTRRKPRFPDVAKFNAELLSEMAEVNISNDEDCKGKIVELAKNVLSWHGFRECPDPNIRSANDWDVSLWVNHKNEYVKLWETGTMSQRAEDGGLGFDPASEDDLRHWSILN